MKEQEVNSDTLTHNIHQYTAKLIPGIPRFLINKYSEEGDVVLDPFCGSGTTLLEAMSSGRNAIGIDINPLAVLISEVKVKPLRIDELKLAANLVRNEFKTNGNTIDFAFPNIDYWFLEHAKNELARIRLSIDAIRPKINEGVYKFLLVCFSSIIKKSSNADTRIPKTCKSRKMTEKIRNGWRSDPIGYFNYMVEKNIQRMTQIDINGKDPFVRVFEGDARETSHILEREKIAKVDLITTSPPYINAQDYLRSYKLELFWLGFGTPQTISSLKNNVVGTEHSVKRDYNSIPRSKNQHLNDVLEKIWLSNKKMNRKKAHIVYKYFNDMRVVFNDFHRTIRKGGKLCLIIGNNTICEVSIPTFDILTEIAENEGFRLAEKYVDEIRNRSLFPNRNHKGGTIRDEWIGVFEN